jgi:hypothetical protein
MPCHTQDGHIYKVLQVDDKRSERTVKGKLLTLELMPPYMLLERSRFAEALSTHLTHMRSMTRVGLDVPLHFLS